MGNCFSSKSGRTLDESPRAAQAASSQSAPRPVGGAGKSNATKNPGPISPGRTIGQPTGAGGNTPGDPREAAALAAQARADKAKESTGKLSSKLNQDRGKSRSALLQEASRDNARQPEPLIYD